MNEVWDAPGSEGGSVEPKPPGTPAGAFGPEPIDVAKAVWADISTNPVGYFLAGGSYLVAVMGLIAIALSAVGLGLAPGLVLEDENLLVLGGIIGFGVYTISVFGFAFAVFPLMNAALVRAIDDQRKGESTLGFASGFSGMTHRAGSVIVFYLMCQALVLIGMLLLYVPGIIAAVVTTFAFPIFVLEEGISPVDALTKAWEHIKAQPLWHVVVWLTLFGALIAAELTVVGLLVMFPVMVAWQVYAYRLAFPEST